DRPFAHRRSIAAPRSTRCLLEDVHDRYPARRDSRAAGLFLVPHFEISLDLSTWRALGSEPIHAPARAYLDRFRRHGDCGVSFEKADRTKPGKSLGYGLGFIDRRRNHVVSRRPLSPFAGRANGRYDRAASFVDWFRSNRVGGLSGHIAIDVDYRGG